MKEPIKAGDECIVIGGASGPKNQVNLGRRVIVVSLQGDHSRFGRIWRCRTKDGKPLERHMGTFANEGMPTDLADFAASWLAKPDELPTTDHERELVFNDGDDLNEWPPGLKETT